jgi:hypothetical protein
MARRSAIFQEEKNEQEDGHDGRIDLTKEQITKDDSAENLIDDFDLLEAKLDPRDLASQVRKARLEQEIEDEKLVIKAKFLWKAAFAEDDPLKILQ